MGRLQKRLILILTLSLFGAVACTASHKDFRAPRVEDLIGAKQTTVNSNWTPAKANISCAAHSCPEGVGVLLFSQPLNESEISLVRCTAFLIAPDRIVSNGHCDHLAAHSGFFVVRGPAGTTVFRRISTVLHKSFAENAEHKESTSGRPDVLVLQLDQPIEGVELSKFDTQVPRSFGALTAYVINERSSDGTEYAIDARECNFHRHEALQPFDINESPDVLRAFDCSIVGGNSGSPLVATNGLVQAIVQAGMEAAESGGGQPFEAHRVVVATNTRCVDYLGGDASKCVVADQAELDRRFAVTQRQALDDLSHLEIPEASSYATGFAVYPYQLRTTPGDFTYLVDLAYLPNCRATDGDLNQLTFVNRKMKMIFDEWAKPEFVAVAQVTSLAVVLGQRADTYDLQLTWAPSFGEYLQPERDPRRQLGERFSIALPPCPR